MIFFLIEGCGGQFARGGLLHPDPHPLRHPGLLYRAHRQPAQEKDCGQQDEAEASGVPGDLRHGGVLPLLPPLHHCQDDSADCPRPRMASAPAGYSCAALRRPHGALLHRLSSGSAGLLLRQHQVQRALLLYLLPVLSEGR